MSVASALSTLRAARDSIRAAIVGKGGMLPEGSPMSDYPAAISNLPTGGGGGGPIEMTYTGGYVSSALTDEAIANWTLDTSSATNMFNIFNGCRSLTTIPALDTSAVTNFTNMFYECSNLTSVPQLDTAAGKDFSSMFYNCAALTSVPQLDTAAATNFTQMFRFCRSLATIPQLDTSRGTNFSFMFANCSSMTSVPQLDTSRGTNFNNMFANASSLTQIGIHGFTRSIDISGCKLDADNLNAFFTQAGEAYSASQTINITGNPGATDCDKTIATSKGWTVTG